MEMKPRLTVLPLTDEDYWAWLVRHLRHPVGTLFRRSLESDRRDADLMLLAQHRIGPGPMCCENADMTDFIDTSGARLGSYRWHWSDSDGRLYRNDIT